MGAEGYFGRGNALSSVRDTRAAGANNRFYSTDFQRKFFYGGLLRVACEFCPSYLASFSLGIDRSQFLTKRILTFDPTVTTTFVSRTKGFNGVLFGLGFEKHFGHFGVGLDLKMIQYRRQQTADPVAVPAGQGPATMNFSIRPIIYSAAFRLCYVF